MHQRFLRQRAKNRVVYTPVSGDRVLLKDYRSLRPAQRMEILSRVLVLLNVSAAEITPLGKAPFLALTKVRLPREATAHRSAVSRDGV